MALSLVRVHCKDAWEDKLKALQVANMKKLRFEDFISCPDGTLLGVEGKLGNTDMYTSSFVTDLV